MQPLADRVRPKTLDDFIGQKHLVGPSKPLRQAIEQKKMFPFVLWGPPGVGKTTLARIYANALDARFEELSAVSAGKADIKKIVKEAGGLLGPTVLFLDEVHRFTSAQQDFLLPFVERGELLFIGATTENPSFRVISALLSRLRVFVLNEFNDDEMHQILKRTKIKMNKAAQNWVVSMAQGDARQALNVIEAAQNLYQTVTVESLQEALQNQFLRYDKKGEEHYNTISAFIKSMRASNVDAAIYYLSRMVAAGEDPLFIARRMVVFASEDVGLAQPTALVVANAVFDACKTIGYPECEINLAHGVAYLARAKKDRSAHDALRAAQKDVKDFGTLPIPLSLRNAPTKLMKDLNYGKDYDMYPDKNISLLPDKLKNKKFFRKEK